MANRSHRSTSPKGVLVDLYSASERIADRFNFILDGRQVPFFGKQIIQGYIEGNGLMINVAGAPLTALAHLRQLRFEPFAI